MANQSSDREAEGMGGKTWGALLDRGPVDWQILPRDEAGFGRLSLAGRWIPMESLGLLGRGGGEVEARLVREDSGAPLEGLDWTPAETFADGTWRLELSSIPSGGLYRLESRFNPKGNKLGEWSLRGDMRHYLGVGDVWIIAGQSNASGYAKGPYFDEPELGLHMLRHNGAWGLATHPLGDSTDTAYPAVRETYNPGHSPFLHFARLLRRELGCPIGLIPAALGGSPLEAWDPRHASGGPLAANLAGMAARAGGRVKGIVWYQGESDAEPGRAEGYLKRFLAAAAAWREALGRPRLPILTAQLGRYYSRSPGGEDLEWSQVREAQRQAARLDPDITVVPALDLPLEDSIHLDVPGNMVLGERLARCALGAVYAKKLDFLAPDLVEAVRDGDRGLRLKFAPVISRLESADPISQPFRVEDDAGIVPVERVAYFRRNEVMLTLGRPGSGRISVSCGYGENPPALPRDVERRMPVLAFHGWETTG